MTEFERIPRIRDLEYLQAFIHGLKQGGLKQAEEEVVAVRISFEEEKDRALGKGKRLKRVSCRSLVAECVKMCRHLGLVRKDNKTIIPIEQAECIITDRYTLLDRLLHTYSSFRRLLLAIHHHPEGKIYATIDRGEAAFRKSISKYDIEIQQWNFEMARDLATALQVLNWRELDQGEMESVLGKRGCVVYMISRLVTLSELTTPTHSPSNGFHGSSIQWCAKDLGVHNMANRTIIEKAVSKRYMIFDIDGEQLLMKNFGATKNEFERILWREYLKLTNQIPRSPVYYSELKDKVCEKLRLSDNTFNLYIIELIQHPEKQTLRVYPGGGILPRHLSYRRKNIPPKYGYDTFIVYLKIEQKRGELV